MHISHPYILSGLPVQASPDQLWSSDWCILFPLPWFLTAAPFSSWTNFKNDLAALDSKSCCLSLVQAMGFPGIPFLSFNFVLPSVRLGYLCARGLLGSYSHVIFTSVMVASFCSPLVPFLFRCFVVRWGLLSFLTAVPGLGVQAGPRRWPVHRR